MQQNTYRLWAAIGIALALALAAVATVSAEGKGETAVAGEKPTIRFYMSDMGRTKFTKDTYIFQMIAERMGGVNLELFLVPRSDRKAKFATLIAGGDLPDIMMVDHSSAYDIAMDYGPKGLFYPVDTKLKDMKELAKIRRQIPEYDKVMTANDGHMYAFCWVAPFPFFTLGILASPAFQKVGYDPKKDLDTVEDLYAALKKVKALDPKNFPMTTRAGNDLGRMWLIYGTDIDPFPDTKTGKYVYGPVMDNYRKMIGFMAKAYADGLLHPDFFTMTEEAWRELFAGAQTHFTIDHFSQGTTLATDPNNASTWLTAILPPKVDGKRYWASMDRGSVNPGEGVWLISAKTKHIDNLIKFCDWGYSEEGFLDMFYGRLGEVSTLVDGYRKFIIPEGKTYPNVWKGEETINSLGLRQYSYVFRNSKKDLLNPIDGNVPAIQWQLDVDKYYNDNKAIKPWKPLLRYSVEEQDIVKQLATPIKTLAMENSIKFIRGEKPLSDWNKHVADLTAMGLEKLMAVYDAAYARFNATK